MRHRWALVGVRPCRTGRAGTRRPASRSPLCPWAQWPYWTSLRVAHQRLAEGGRRDIGGRLADPVRAESSPSRRHSPRGRDGSGRVGAGTRSVAAAALVDHHRHADRLQDRDRLRQILHVDPELQVPAEPSSAARASAPTSSVSPAAVVQLSVAEEMVEPQAAHAERRQQHQPPPDLLSSATATPRRRLDGWAR